MDILTPPRGRPKVVVAPPPVLRPFRREEWGEDQVYQLRLPDGTVHWKSHPGPQTFALACQCDLILYGGARGGGKLSPLESLVCTPKGFVQMGSLSLGDLVTDPVTGSATRVIGIHPQGVKPIWRLTFDDGASLEVGDEHLWAYRAANRHLRQSKFSSQKEFCREVLGSSRPKSRWDKYRVGPTSEIRKAFEAGEGIRIPLSEPVLFTVNGRTSTGPVDAYTAGVMLGDGCCGHLSVTACDDEIREHLISTGYTAGADLHSDGKPKTYTAAGDARRHMDVWLRNHGLRHARSWEKFVPPYIFTAPIDYRLAFLQGLMDTDGTIDERGRVYFISTSQKLAEGVQQLARSLGGKARIRPRQTQYTYNDVKQDGRPSFQVRIWHPKLSAFFRIQRKKDRATDSWNGGHEITRELVAIDYVGEKEAQCISVSSPYGLYVADDFIVTHNTAGGIAWLQMGDPTLPEGHHCRTSYLNDPNYKALVLRESYSDLRDWIDEAKVFFAPFGGKPHDDPAIFTFPSGAKIFTNHLGNPDAFSKFKSWNIIRILIEELTLIPDKKLFLKVLGSNRSKWPHLRPQTFCTTNPDGPGSQWVKDYFVDVYSGGKKIPWGTPMRDPVTKLSRIFIPAKLDDNPSLNQNDRYRGILLSQDPDTRAAWLDGDWDGSVGPYFKEFRPRGPHSHEAHLYPWARHVIPVQPIPYWYNRWASGDWGYSHKAAFYKFAQNEQDGRVHTYDELIFQGVGAFEMGVSLAKWLQPDLESLPDNRITLYLSPDAFAKRDDTNTLAEQMRAGICKYLGPYSSFIMQFNAEEKQVALTDRAQAEKMFAYRQQMFSGKMAILLKAANNDRVGGWNYIREMFRYIPVLPDVKADMAYAEQLYMQKGLVAYTEYLEQFKNIKPEILPKAVIHDCCPALIKCLSTLVHDEKHKEDVQKVDGDDPGDAYRYGMKAHQDQEATRQPLAAFMGERLAAAAQKHDDINILIQVSRNAQAQWELNNPKILTWTPPRQGSMRWRQ